MTDFNPALDDGSDPLYAPGISWSGRFAYWKPPAKYRKAGYEIARVKLEPGSRDDEHAHARALRCRDLTREMLRWYAGEEEKVKPGTWAYLIARYISDEFSPIKFVKANTRENYLWCLAKWEAAIGQSQLSDADYEFVMGLQAGMKANGRSTSYIKRLFTMMRGIVSYGANVGIPECDRIQRIGFDDRTVRNVKLALPYLANCPCCGINLRAEV